jgi:hypothetical protein
MIPIMPPRQRQRLFDDKHRELIQHLRTGIKPVDETALRANKRDDDDEPIHLV